MPRTRPVRSSQRGASAVELGLVSLVLFPILVGDLEFSGTPSEFDLVYNEATNVELPAGAVGLTR
ncbi:MAG: hypothetical protein AVDCRST_MAG47-1780 [uncultured Nocardioidaceae bacterium]|uniref:Uncharacterized protein n=1 Tax=uncultured Nocardioidaceae bacterium TaxID=253824 RepID=A0A6J4N4P7_9ACTN|nr:MAG: hypothetical protein AVDCRST_MAG47-1780 [uncultured Nocardioidaceae bacterium]